MDNEFQKHFLGGFYEQKNVAQCRFCGGELKQKDVDVWNTREGYKYMHCIGCNIAFKRLEKPRRFSI